MGIKTKTLVLTLFLAWALAHMKGNTAYLQEIGLNVSSPNLPTSFSQSSVRLLAQYSSKQLRLLGATIYGNWSSQFPPFNFFSSIEGQTQQYFIFNRSKTPNEPPHVNSLVIVLRDPEYSNKKMAAIILSLQGQFSTQKNCWEGVTQQGQLILFDKLVAERNDQNLSLAFFVNETFVEVKTVAANQTQTEMSGQNVTPSFMITITQHPQKFQVFAPWVLLIPSIILMLGMHFREPMPPLKVSVVTLLVSLNFMLFVALLELYVGIENVGNSYGWFILTGLVSFASTVNFTQGFQQPARRIVGIQGYILFCTITLVYLWCFFAYCWDGWFQIVNSLILVPQILHNAYHGLRPGFSSGYYLVLLSNQLYIFYYRGVPHNVMRVSPSFEICAAVCLSILLQLLILACQDKYGSRFFIPKCLIPNFYNYYLEVQLTDINKSMTHPLMDDCPICLFPLNDEPAPVDFEKGSGNLNIPTKKRLMKTPCNHVFHVVCLENWMEHKFQCPVDRSKLPPLQ